MVDDERNITDTLVAILNQSGFQAVGAYDGIEVTKLVRGKCPDILLTDVVMPKMDGIQLAIAVRDACSATRIVLISGQGATADYLERARAQGYQFEFLPKPIEPEELLERLSHQGK